MSPANRLAPRCTKHIRGGLPVDSRARGRSFPTTSVTDIGNARNGDQDAIASLADRYGTPAFCFFIQHHVDREKAKDLTQEFFIKLIRGQLLARFALGRRPFRPYLKKVLKNIILDDARRENAAGRHPEGGLASLDHILGQVQALPADGLTPEEAFDRAYAKSVLKKVISRVKAECRRADLGTHFKIFAKRYLENDPPGWQEIGKKHGVSSGETARNMAGTVERRFRKAMKDEIRTDDMSDEDFAEEIRDLLRAFSAAPKRAALLSEIESL